jgi:pimeloyl-ACP methyl ester carboxylesterase
MASRAVEGFLHDDIPYLRMGAGPPLVVVSGLTPDHAVPKGWERRMALTAMAPLAAHFTVYSVNRKRGLRPEESMSDIVGHLVNAIEHDIQEPVFLDGLSTGGSMVLQLAIDRPDLVRRLVVLAAAYRLGPGGQALQAEMARLARAGDTNAVFAAAMTAMLPKPARVPMRPVTALAGRAMAPHDPSDLLVTLDAEDVFDVEADLPRITAPTLVIGGTRDVFYSRELFEGTAAGVRDGRLHLFEGWGHGRTCQSSATWNLTLGFMLAGLPG